MRGEGSYSHKILDQLQQLCGGSRCRISTGHAGCGLLQCDGQTRHQLVHMVIQLQEREAYREGSREGEKLRRVSKNEHDGYTSQVGQNLATALDKTLDKVLMTSPSGRFQQRLLLLLGSLSYYHHLAA